MWKRFADSLRCPVCKERLWLSAFRQVSVAISYEDAALAKSLDLYSDDFGEYIDYGLLLCDQCKKQFPIIEGLPVLLPYTTPLHRQFASDFAGPMSQTSSEHRFADEQPVAGERFVLESFSKEWIDYKYDGVLWDESYGDLEETFLQELNFTPHVGRSSAFVEIGCGLGVSTHLAHKNYGADAVGLDLSLAAMKACRHYRGCPFLNFVQASAFYLPFTDRSFDIVYSRGVLHHTFSTHKAFESVAALVRRGGTIYIWVYGPGSIRDGLFRRSAFLVESAIRPILSRSPSSVLSKAFLSLAAVGYLCFNAIHRTRVSGIEKYDFQRALHAARDRFTPRYAHRQRPEEVVEWFRQAGFEEIEVIDWRSVPPAQQEPFQRNVGVRGKL